MAVISEVVVVGKESSGKSQLISSLTGKNAYSANFCGSTIECEKYETPEFVFIDTPGILTKSDTETTRLALAKLNENETILAVVKATTFDEDLSDLLPLIKEKKGAIVSTFSDKLDEKKRKKAIEVGDKHGVQIILVDARRLSDSEKRKIMSSLKKPKKFDKLHLKFGWKLEPQQSFFEHRISGPIISLAILLFPAIVAVLAANFLAGYIDPIVQGFFTPIIDFCKNLQPPISDVLAGKYGLFTMGPLLLVWAVPTVVIYSILLGVYKASGLIERLSMSVHPITLKFGLSGRDLIRFMMGFGCKVPAVLTTRGCSNCSRDTCIHAISFGSACSYQLGATLAVFAAIKMDYLVMPYLMFLAATALIYTRIISAPEARSEMNSLVIRARNFIEIPNLRSIWFESKEPIKKFFFKALPIFVIITMIASMVEWFGLLNLTANFISPFMAIFNLPADAALPIIFASIRKDGILLFTNSNISSLSSVQVLTAVYLAGVLLPCIVTAFTIVKEKSIIFTLKLIGKQVFFAILFSVILAWFGGLIIG